MTIEAASISFPPAPEVGDVYSIWKFDGIYWLLNDVDSGVTWDSLKSKPQSISALGESNQVVSDPYQTSKGIQPDKASDSWSKNK